VLNSVDFIVFVEIAREKVGKETQDVRYIHFRGDSSLEAGSRFSSISDKIPYSASGFIEEVEKAILADGYNGDKQKAEEARITQLKEHEEKSNEYIQKQLNSVEKLGTAEELIEHLKGAIGQFSGDEEKMTEIKTVIKKYNSKKVDYTKMKDVEKLKAIAEFVDSLG
jgi:hypothetical protein